MDLYAIPYILFTVGMWIYIGIWFNKHVKRGEKKVWVWDEIAKAKQPLQLELMLPIPVFRDIEEVAKSTPEYKEAKKKHDAKHSAAVMERNRWNKDFTDLKKELKRKHCKHVYDHASDWNWWVCTECDYENTPYYTYECDCDWDEDYSYYHQKKILTRRNPLCRVHGRDIQKYQELRYEYHKLELFAKGGIIKKEY